MIEQVDNSNIHFDILEKLKSSITYNKKVTVINYDTNIDGLDIHVQGAGPDITEVIYDGIV